MLGFRIKLYTQSLSLRIKCLPKSSVLGSSSIRKVFFAHLSSSAKFGLRILRVTRCVSHYLRKVYFAHPSSYAKLTLRILLITQRPFDRPKLASGLYKPTKEYTHEALSAYQADRDIKANLMLDLPKSVYNRIDYFKTHPSLMWQQLEKIMLGSSIKVEKTDLELNLKFLNTLQPEWNKSCHGLRNDVRISTMQIQELYEILMTDESLVIEKKDKLEKKKKTVDLVALLTNITRKSSNLDRVPSLLASLLVQQSKYLSQSLLLATTVENRVTSQRSVEQRRLRTQLITEGNWSWLRKERMEQLYWQKKNSGWITLTMKL
ncbi:hypothetical protein L6452_14402 [Arctium lappa]|uniref:Uncharacterized protein n=1 Tax=Arctium lappa TaxID=4217 RepID=A0ACB9CKV8_ARCLA|nr:hypothetical protein L6452_14402 [Arctium lappa]